MPGSPCTPLWSGDEVLGSDCAVPDGLTAGPDLPPGSPGIPAPLFGWVPRGACPVVVWLMAWSNTAGAPSIAAVDRPERRLGVIEVGGDDAVRAQAPRAHATRVVACGCLTRMGGLHESVGLQARDAVE